MNAPRNPIEAHLRHTRLPRRNKGRRGSGQAAGRVIARVQQPVGNFEHSCVWVHIQQGRAAHEPRGWDQGQLARQGPYTVEALSQESKSLPAIDKSEEAREIVLELERLAPDWIFIDGIRLTSGLRYDVGLKMWRILAKI